MSRRSGAVTSVDIPVRLCCVAALGLVFQVAVGGQLSNSLNCLSEAALGVFATPSKRPAGVCAPARSQAGGAEEPVDPWRPKGPSVEPPPFFVDSGEVRPDVPHVDQEAPASGTWDFSALIRRAHERGDSHVTDKVIRAVPGHERWAPEASGGLPSAEEQVEQARFYAAVDAERRGDLLKARDLLRELATSTLHSGRSRMARGRLAVVEARLRRRGSSLPIEATFDSVFDVFVRSPAIESVANEVEELVAAYRLFEQHDYAQARATRRMIDLAHKHELDMIEETAARLHGQAREQSGRSQWLAITTWEERAKQQAVARLETLPPRQRLPATVQMPTSLPEYAHLAPELSAVFSNSVTDTAEHNNQTLDTYKEARRLGLIPKEPLVFVHFDTHSDAFRRADLPETDSLADFANRLMHEERISEFIWVLPDRAAETEALFNPDAFIGAAPSWWRKMIDAEEFATKVLLKAHKDTHFYVDRQESKLLFQKPREYETHSERYHVIRFRKLTLDELPDMAGVENLWVDIDGDYLSNVGNDTFGYAVSQFGGIPAVERFVRTLHERNFRPILTTNTRSPSYVEVPVSKFRASGLTTGVRPYVDGFLYTVGAHSKVHDLLVSYEHADDQGRKKGTNISRVGDPELEALFWLKLAALDTDVPNDRIVFDQHHGVQDLEGADMGKRARATKVIEVLFPDRSPSEVLRALAARSGTDDGQIDTSEARHQAAPVQSDSGS